MNFELARFNMVEQQIRPWSVFDEKVLNLLGSVKREDFTQPQYATLALSDIEIPLPGEQKMLFPRIEARLLQELKLNKSDKVLEIGTGSGYVTALLAKLTDFVYSIEINAENKQFAVNNLMKAGIKNVSIIEADGLFGMIAKAPYDKIFIGGAVKAIPETIKQQLAIGGSLVAVIGNAPIMEATLVRRVTETKFEEITLFETQLDHLISLSDNKFIF